MRANRMLYPLGAAVVDLATTPQAQFVPFSKVPKPADYGSVATCHLSLLERLTQAGHRGRRIFRVLEGGWYRIIGLSLPEGRFGFLQEMESHPGEVSMYLPVWRELHLHRADYFATRALLGLSDDQITLHDGPFLWR